MNRVILLLSLFAFVAAASAAEGPSPAEMKMREALRNTMLQLRTAETERANLQTANTELTEKLKEAEAKIAALGKQLADDKTAADKASAELTDKLAARDGDIVQLKESLAKWKASHEQILAIAKTKETERAKFEAKSISLDRIVADQQRKNDAMYQLGTEVLNRYEKFDMGDALFSRGQFIGITRVKFENLIQDYADKLTDAKIKPTPAPAKAEKPAPAATPKPAKSAKPAKSGAVTS